MVTTGTNLVEAFKNSDFIAGSAEVEWRIASPAVQHSLKWLANFSRNPSAPNVLAKEKLACALHGMIAIAKAHYAAEGHTEYWPYLEEQLNRVSSDSIFRQQRIQIDGPMQKDLGELFRYALKAFELTVPVSGQQYVGPIVFHAGLPDSSVDGLMRLVLAVVEEKREESLRLPDRERYRIVKDYPYGIHRSVRSIFENPATIVGDLWQSLVRVALAWRTSRDCAKELQELPPFVNPEKVYEFLNESDRRTTVPAEKFSRPEIRYDPLEGRVRIKLNSAHWPEPLIAGPPESRKPKIRQVGDHFVWNFYEPLPTRISIESPRSGAKEEIHVMSDERRGIWFEGNSGKLVTADQVDRYGLTPGTWHLLIQGEPSGWNVQRPERCPLSWSDYVSGRDWTAWEVEVPERTEAKPCLEFRYSDIQQPVRIHLAKKPVPRFEFANYSGRYAWNESAGRFAVFSEQPRVQTRVGQNVALRIWRWSVSGWNLTSDLEIPGGGTAVPIEIQPGCYRLTEKRGIGREVARLAYVPGLSIGEPEYDAQGANVRIECHADAGFGAWDAGRGVELSPLTDGKVEIRSSTVEPRVTWAWRWHGSDQPPLTFETEVEGLRWRVTGLTRPDDAEHPALRWTRNPVFLTKQEGRQSSGRLEIQYPQTRRLSTASDGVEKLTGASPCGKFWSERLTPFVDREVLEMRLADCEPITVLVISDRPRLSHFEVEMTGQELHVNYGFQEISDESVHQALSLFAWNLADPGVKRTEYPLTQEALAKGSLVLPVDRFEGHETTAFAIGRKIRRGFGKETLLFASYGDAARSPFGVRFDWASGDVRTSSDVTLRSWGAMLHQATLEWLEGRSRKAGEYREWATMAETEADFAWESVLTWLTDQSAAEGRNPEKSSGQDAFVTAWWDVLRIRIWQDSSILLQVPRHRWHAAVLYCMGNEGLTLGQGCPDRWKSGNIGDDDVTVYPFQWIRDLATVSVREWPSEYDARNSFERASKEAAERLWRSAEGWGIACLFELLPEARGTAQTPDGLNGGPSATHQHRIRFERKIPRSVEDLREALGVDDLYLDVSLEDQRLNMPQPAWLARKTTWSLEFTDGRKNPKCCVAHELICGFPEPAEIVRLQIAQCLQDWTQLDTAEALESPEVTSDGDFERYLRPDERIGTIQDELLPDLRPRAQSLFGQQVSTPLRVDSSPKAQIAWRLAWTERALALESRSRSNFGGARTGLTAELSQAFQRQLAESLRVWPELMKRSIALAEFLVRIYRTEGIGRGFRQAVDRADHRAPQSPKILINPVAGIRRVEATERRPITEAICVILAYHPKHRFAELLVKHPSHASIQEALDLYASLNSDNKPWLAYFRLEEVRSAELSRLARARIPDHQWRGLVVKCRLNPSFQKDPNWVPHKWWAEDIRFLPNFERCQWP